MRNVLQVLAALMCSSVLVLPGSGQDLGAIQDELSDGLSDLHFAKSLTGLILVTEEVELSGAHYNFEGDEDVEMSTIVFPFQKSLKPWGEGRMGLHLEGALGYASANSQVDDLYNGQIPGLETALDSDWVTYGGFFGIGPELELRENLSVAALVQLGLTRLENDTDYSGPGAAVTAAITDGIAFNWDSLVGTLGPAVRVDWTRPLGEDHRLELIGRYDLRWTETLEQDDPAQEFSSRSQLLTLRAELVGPTGWSLFEGPVGWRASAGYRGFLEGDLFGVDELIVLGGSLELDLGERLPVANLVRANAAAIFGDQLTGWSVGLGLSL